MDAIRAQLTARNNPEAPVPVEHTKPDKEEIAKKPYQFLLVSALREYLAFEMKTDTPFPWDQERVFDDFGVPCRSAFALSLSALRVDARVCS
jgi:5'-3' exonuclease